MKTNKTLVGYEIFSKSLQVAGKCMKVHQPVVVKVGYDDILRITSYVDYLERVTAEYINAILFIYRLGIPQPC